MNCLTQQQIVEFLEGAKSEQAAEHLADCSKCRTLLLRTMADKDPEFRMQPGLSDATTRAMLSMSAPERRFVIPGKHGIEMMFPQRVWAFAAAAMLILAAGAALFFAHNPRGEDKGIVTSSSNVAHTAHAVRDTIAVKRAVVSKNAVMMFDSVKVTLGKIPVRKDKESLIRFGGKTGIAAGAAADITVRSRTDTTAYIELTKGNALFSVEKNRYRQFVVQTPTLKIVVTGTTFSVTADSAYTLVNVVEGSVRVQHRFKTAIATILTTGDGAFANRDSITNVIVENSGMLKVRQRLLRDYIEGTSFRTGTDGLPGASGGNDAGGRQDGGASAQ
jgi:FecR protein